MRCAHFLTPVISRTTEIALLLGCLALPASAGAAVEPLLAEATPLVLKDGRIANVSVHRIPFAVGEEMLDEATAEQLRGLMRPLATDCFLTAQAIGHVAPGVTRDGDTLSAHRLARARADHVQAELAGLGMPQPAVASVWDWQFLVERSQVTLWVFSLSVGDDCDGEPLPGEAVVSAEATAEGPNTAAVEANGEAPPPPRELRVPESAIDETASAILDGPTAVTELAPPSDAEEAAPSTPALSGNAIDEANDLTSRRAAVAGQLAASASAAADAVIRDPLATAAVAPLSPAPADPVEAATPAAEAEQAEEAAPPMSVAAIDQAAAAPPPTPDGLADLAITFNVNSSYFPSGAAQQLRRFLETLPTDAAVRVELAGAVGTGDVRGATSDEAERYNAWMAERRIERVSEWLDGNAGDRRLTVTERLVEGDSSRQVRIKASVAE